VDAGELSGDLVVAAAQQDRGAPAQAAGAAPPPLVELVLDATVGAGVAAPVKIFEAGSSGIL
jgi:hypothetical protein